MAMDSVETLNLFLQDMPFVRYMGVVVLEIGEQGLLCHMPFKKEFIGNPNLPAIHGGAIASFLETSAIATANWSASALGQSDVALPVSVSFDYLRSAATEDLYARTYVVKQGRRLAQITCAAYQSDPLKPVTSLHASFLMSRHAATA
jgi:uncharacterized protein (TIGR00369 family)